MGIELHKVVADWNEKDPTTGRRNYDDTENLPVLSGTASPNQEETRSDTENFRVRPKNAGPNEEKTRSTQ